MHRAARARTSSIPVRRRPAGKTLCPRGTRRIRWPAGLRRIVSAGCRRPSADMPCSCPTSTADPRSHPPCAAWASARDSARGSAPGRMARQQEPLVARERVEEKQRSVEVNQKPAEAASPVLPSCARQPEYTGSRLCRGRYPRRRRVQAAAMHQATARYRRRGTG